MYTSERILWGLCAIFFIIGIMMADDRIEKQLQKQIDTLNAINHTLIGDIPND